MINDNEKEITENSFININKVNKNELIKNIKRFKNSAILTKYNIFFTFLFLLVLLNLIYLNIFIIKDKRKEYSIKNNFQIRNKEIYDDNKNNIITNNIENYFLKKLVEKAMKTKNLFLLNNYIELDKLFHNDRRYDGARNCLVEYKKNSTCIYNYLFPKKVLGKKRKLIGGRKSTSYVLLDDFKGIKIAYSIGIGSKDWFLSFDQELADKNIDIYMYDHTINKLPYQNPKFHFHKIGLSGNYNSKNSALKSLYQILEENKHLKEKNMILKVDCEGCEWEALLDFPEELLKNFKYMVFELHFQSRDFLLFTKVLSKLSTYHQIFYVHCVNCGTMIQYGDMRICKALEVSYVIKEGNEFSKDDSDYPIPELETKCSNQIFDFNDNIL